ncbi:tyrosine-type recombinase/integrase [Pyramidobacter piscolens]|uniref:tyrosine-type recombinase/integrase n=1 Tax=Pyramidobacter piscolens TaxID=638849 RepID=UPI0026664B09|nr:tyrosine-type recombinase/integrase [Pyramidobacter piscolens]
MLTRKDIKGLTIRERPYLVHDSMNLYLEVAPTGRMSWVFRRRLKGLPPQKKVLGRYPEMDLFQARATRDAMMAKARKEQHKAETNGKTFEELAEMWLDARVRGLTTEKHTARQESRLRTYVYPYIKDMLIADLTSPMIYEIEQRIEKTDKIELAHRVVGMIGQILRFGIPIELSPNGDVTRDLKDSMKPLEVTPRAHLEKPDEVAGLMRAIDSLPWELPKAGLMLQAYTLARPVEVRRSRWDEIDLDRALWRIPAKKMKEKHPHLVPLARQVVELLRKIRNTISEDSPWVLHALRSRERPMSDGTLLATLRRLGYSKEEMSVHGFRSIGSTLLNEHQWAPDVVETQLAHLDKDTVRIAYNYAQYLGPRISMMQWYADYLDALRDGRPEPEMPK